MSSFLVTPLIVATALFMEQLDGSVLATALPAMAADLHEDPVALKLALTSYLLSLAVFIPLSGWAADKFGARRIFRAAIVVFTLGSILCGFSGSLATIVAARVVQGLGGAMMVPVGRLVLLRTAPRHELVRAMAWLTIPALIGPLIGPPFGGFIATYLHWRYIFWINVPIGLLGVALVTRFIPDLFEENVRPLDLKGAVLSGVGLSCLVFGFTIAGRGFAPAPVVALVIAIGATALLAYVRHARRAEHPIIDLRLLRIPTFAAAIYGGFLFRIGLGALPFLLPLMLQAGFNLSAYQSGLLTFVAAAGAMAMKTTAQPILKRFGFRRVLIVNAVISSIFLVVNACFTAATPHWLIMSVLLVGGFYRSLQFTALNAIGYADISQESMSNATSFTAVGQQLSLSTGVAIGAAALEASRALDGGGALRAEDFAPAFYVVATISALSAALFWRLAPDAGDELVGRTRPLAPPRS
ncbi:DHA2 family efflux MFS transporter permease subunit [Methylocystis sp. WRRC1]|uniref:DHA2 family efflux MFS transporter permease subunit n=1 Tax=Methylocystis sp. WRRC1 TaxID=1732014 RepID=UPI001D14D806|nr:DHA2 family efflux MFS transporter permease subunit [Methylocystis sp. WRRC1]MCC3244913.1 DHA2 family efflux MFS transporter permease subunit [Methylocystis sp. WRRC1]